MKHKSISWAVVIMAISLTALYAQSDSDFEILQNPDNTITITGYKGNVKNVVIPSTLYGLKVTNIGKGAFREKGITNLILPNTLISIGENAFGSCSDGGAYGCEKNIFTEIVIPNSVINIGDGSFHYVPIVKVSFGSNLKYIGSYAFSESKIKEITIPNLVESIGKFAFKTNEIETINCGTSIKKIERGAFMENKLTELVLPASIETIGGSAFANNRLRSVVIPGKVTIDGEAFAYNQIESITIPDGVKLVYEGYGEMPKVGVFYTNPLSKLVITGSMRIFRTNFRGLPLTRITIPANKDDSFLRDAGFEESFVNFYKNQNRAAKTYYKVGPIWTTDAAGWERIAAEQAAAAEAERIKAEQ